MMDASKHRSLAMWPSALSSLGVFLIIALCSASASTPADDIMVQPRTGSRRSLVSPSAHSRPAAASPAAASEADATESFATADAADASTTIPKSLTAAATAGISRPPSSSRKLASSTNSPACSWFSQQLLTNGYFHPGDTADMFNVLLMATMSNDIYPFARQYNYSLLNVADGLNRQETLEFQRKFTAKYVSLGAHSVQFADYYQPKSLGAAGHAAVIGTESYVFVVFRGTSDFGQGLITGKFETRPWKILDKTLDIYYPVQQSMEGLYPQVLKAVKTAVAATNVPHKAKVYITGHSLGAASSFLCGLLLLEQGFDVDGVWGFDPYKAGTKCEANQDCWVTVYDRYLGDKTWMIWNNQDPIPILTDEHFKTNIQHGNQWGHVPGAQNRMRIIGDQCWNEGGTGVASVCSPGADTDDGVLNSDCPSTFHDHWPWVVLQHVARCALLQPPPAANMRSAAMTGSDRLDSCTRMNVWKVLLGLEPQPAPVAVKRTI